MNRRSLLKLLGAAPLVKPTPQQVSSIGLPGVFPQGIGEPGGMEGNGDTDWALKRLTKLRLRTFFGHQEMEESHWIDRLDPDTAALRSLSITAQFRRTRRIQYRRSVKREMSYLERVIKGEDE